MQCRRHGFEHWVGKIPWRRKWQPTPVFLPGKFHGQRSLAGYSLWGCKELNMTERLNYHHQGIWQLIGWRRGLMKRSQRWSDTLCLDEQKNIGAINMNTMIRDNSYLELHEKCGSGNWVLNGTYELVKGLPRWCNGKESACPCRRWERWGFNPWVRKIPWIRKWQPTPVFLPGESHGQRSLAGYRP